MSDDRQLLNVSSSPHIRAPWTTQRAMQIVICALVLPFIAAVWFFGLRALYIVLLSIGACVAWEILAQRLLGRKNAFADPSAVITGILLAYNLPPAVPWWIPVIGGFFAIVVVKQLFGGLGHNFVNPALAARAFLMASWPALMTTAWMAPFRGSLSGIDAVSTATPLTLLKNAALYGDPGAIIRQLNAASTIQRLFIGNIGGCIGETSALMLLIPGLFLVLARVTDFRIVAGYALSFIAAVLVFPTKGSLLFHLFSGGLILSIFFMATDWVTTPVTKSGRWIFGIGCGILTAVIRLWGSYPEGASYAILLMNICTPLINELTKKRIFSNITLPVSKKEKKK